MGKCPYTWVVGKLQQFAGTSGAESAADVSEAKNLHVTVFKNGEEKVNVTLPAASARWLIDLIPADVVEKIYEEEIPLQQIQEELKKMKKLYPQQIFTMREENRQVQVWLG